VRWGRRQELYNVDGGLAGQVSGSRGLLGVGQRGGEQQRGQVQPEVLLFRLADR